MLPGWIIIFVTNYNSQVDPAGFPTFSIFGISDQIVKRFGLPVQPDFRRYCARVLIYVEILAVFATEGETGRCSA